MKQEQFIEILISHYIDYAVENDRIIITDENFHVNLEELDSLPENVSFNNNGVVWLDVEHLPNNTHFNNGHVYARVTLTLHDNVQFNNNSRINTNLHNLPSDLRQLLMMI